MMDREQASKDVFEAKDKVLLSAPNGKTPSPLEWADAVTYFIELVAFFIKLECPWPETEDDANT